MCLLKYMYKVFTHQNIQVAPILPNTWRSHFDPQNYNVWLSILPSSFHSSYFIDYKTDLKLNGVYYSYGPASRLSQLLSTIPSTQHAAPFIIF